MCQHKSKLIFLFLILVLSVFSGAAWWNSNWEYRKPVNVTEQSGTALSNYPVKINLDTESLVSSGKMQSDCGDIRLANSTDQQLDYWIEGGCNTTSTEIWVEVGDIDASSTEKIYLYYGNSSVNGLSNGVKTFQVFDGFDDGDYTGWQTYCENSNGDSCSFSVSNGYFKGQTTDSNSDGDEEDTGDGSIYTNTGHLEGQVVTGDLWIDDPGGGGDTGLFTGVNARESDIRTGDGAGWDTQGEGYSLQISHDTENCYLIGDQDETGNNGDGSYHCTEDSGLKSGSDPGYPDRTWFDFKHKYYRDESSEFYFWTSGDQPSTPQINYNPGTTPTNTGGYVSFGFTDEYEFRLDNIRVRKYTSPEPSTSVGSEESVSICDRRGPKEECIVNSSKNISGESYSIQNIFEAKRDSIFDSFGGQATISVFNKSIISGSWNGDFNISAEETTITAGASFRPKNRIILNVIE